MAPPLAFGWRPSELAVVGRLKDDPMTARFQKRVKSQ